MIIDTEIEISLNKGNIEYYKSLGYDVNFKKIIINIEHLTKGSKMLINVKCDICNNVKSIAYRTYNVNIKNQNIYACSSKCSRFKVKKSNLERYGVENVSQVDIFKEKRNSTFEIRYGGHPLKNKEVKEKFKKTNLEKYGTEYSTQSEIVKEKTKKTNLEKYGTEYTFQNSLIKEKSKKTIISKYGSEHHMQSDIVKDKIKKTNLERYGTEYGLQNSDIRDKITKTNIEKYSAKTPLENSEILNKMYDNNLAKYGTEYITKLPKTKDKIKKTNLEKYGVENQFELENVKDKIKENRKNNIDKINLSTIKKYNKLLNNDEFNILSYSNKSFKILHKKCNNEFAIEIQHLYDRLKKSTNFCTKCYPISEQKSIKEKELINWLETLNVKFVTSDKTILNPKHLDIFFPSHNLAIEFNGLYWHSELRKNNNYHLEKSLECRIKNIHLIHIWEDEWIFKQNIIKSIILNKLGLIKYKIYARKCDIRIIKDVKIIENFLNSNHIDGYIENKINLGLYYNNDLVSVMCFDYTNKKNMKLSRFCNKINCNVIGSATKLFKYFIKNYTFEKLESFSDFRLFEGNIYENLGFEKYELSKPSYFWCKGINRYESTFKNVKNAISDGYYRIFNCGYYKFNFKINK